jgi:hypothetical protein
MKNFFINLLLRFLPCAGFELKDMNRIQGGTVTLWLYKSITDTVATMIASGYFDPVAELVRQGDVIIVVDTNVPTIDVLTVTSVDGAAIVTTLNGT